MLAERVGLSPRRRKALKINERFRRYVSQDLPYKCDKRQAQIFHSELARFATSGVGINGI
jgi:hypothetical protein